MSTNDLLEAAADGNIPEIRQLLEAGVDVNCIGELAGNSPLYNATYTDHVEAVERLLKAGADPNLRLNYRSPVDGRQERGVVALMYARSVAAAKALLDAGADANAVDDVGVTPLMRAAYRANVGIVRLLMNAGADPRHTTKKGATALDIAKAQIEEYESWVVGRDRSLVAAKVERLEEIVSILISAMAN